MSTTATAAVPVTTAANTFQFTSHAGHTKVTYSLEPNGPPVAGRPFAGPVLSYVGPEGPLTFNGDQITQDDTPMGPVVSVVLIPQRDAGSTAFSLLLPPVTIRGSETEKFTTYAVKTRRPGFVNNPGAQLTYEIEHLQGSAEFIRFHPL